MQLSEAGSLAALRVSEAYWPRNLERSGMIKTRAIIAILGAMVATLAVDVVSAEPDEYVGHGFAPVNGTRLFYEVKGTGPAIVLIHGGQLDCRMWDDQFSVFSRQFRIIRYDVRGYGGSFRPESLYSDAEDLAALLDYLKVDTVHVVGLSLGGRIAIDFALAHPTRVGSLTLAGPGLSGYEPPGGAETDLRMWEIIKAARDDGAGSGHGAVAEGPFHGPSHGASPAGGRLAKDSPRECPLLAGEPQSSSDHRRPAAATRLGEIKVRTLLLIGDRDVPQIKATVETLERGIKGAKKVSIKGAGHMVNMESPDAFNEAVLGFLRNREPQPATAPASGAGGALPTTLPGSSAAGQVLHVAEMNTGQIRELDRTKTVVLLTGGILEEHGPYLPAHTDGILSERLTAGARTSHCREEARLEDLGFSADPSRCQRIERAREPLQRSRGRMQCALRRSAPYSWTSLPNSVNRASAGSWS